ncbi:MAG: hypothetical protein V4497_12115 [Bacteroidota bacterium]
MKCNNPLYRWMVGLALILIIYSFFYLFFAENPSIYEIPRRIRHVIKFVVTVLVYFIGTSHLGQIEARWMLILWHFIHVSFLFVITSVGLYDWFFGMVGVNTKEFVASMQEILISPVFYVGLGIVNQKLAKQF